MIAARWDEPVFREWNPSSSRLAEPQSRMLSDLWDALEDLRASSRLRPGQRARLSRPVRGPRRIVFPERREGDRGARILLTANGRSGYERTLSSLTLRDLVLCHPTRDYSRRPRQLNKPIAFYSRTVRDLVMCESQLESKFVLIADWHPGAVHVAAQPFTLEFPADSAVRLHTPDFVLIGADGSVLVVDVKRPDDAERPETIERHAAVSRLLAQAGIRHVVWTGSDPTALENLANFAGAFVPDSLFTHTAPTLLAAHRDGMTVRQLANAAAEQAVPANVAIVAVRRLLWERRLAVDMTVPFSTRSIVHRT